jgi:hypothetical protein
MLKMLKRRQARFIALLAKVARDERDALLGNISEKDLGEPKPGRGEHNPTAALGFEPLPQDAAQVLALREAITGLSRAARSELYALMRIGQGHLGAKNWEQGISETELIGDEAITASLTADVDLHDHLLKGLYELKIAA